jgi:hypothetical protein
VRYIEETEEFLKRTRHFASPELRAQFDRSFILHGEAPGLDDEDEEDDEELTLADVAVIQEMAAQDELYVWGANEDEVLG